MPELSQKLDRFTATILAQATAEAKRALDEVKARREEAYSAAEDQILAEVYRYIRSEVGRIKSESGRAVSRHMLENKRRLYLRREEIAHEVFAAVREKITAYTATDDYAARLGALFHEALRTLNGAEDVTVCLRAADMGRAADLAEAAPEVLVRFEEGSFVLGGLIAESQELGLYLDSTFDTALEELDGHFAELFGLSLSDEMEEEQLATKRE